MGAAEVMMTFNDPRRDQELENLGIFLKIIGTFLALLVFFEARSSEGSGSPQGRSDGAIMAESVQNTHHPSRQCDLSLMAEQPEESTISMRGVGNSMMSLGQNIQPENGFGQPRAPATIPDARSSMVNSTSNVYPDHGLDGSERPASYGTSLLAPKPIAS